MYTSFCRCCQGKPQARQGLGRRALARLATGALALAALPSAGQAADPMPRTSLTPDQALALLKEGNQHFATEAPFRAAQGRERRIALAQGQAPFCVLIGCSDSRVPPELLFGRGLGELFIVRNAGNTIDIAALGSVEYGVGVLGCPLLVVMGHERCGAVAAAVELVERGASFPGVIGDMIQPIIPAVLSARREGDTTLDAAVRANARRVAARLRIQSPVLQEALGAGRLKIVPAYYDLDDGEVHWLEGG